MYLILFILTLGLSKLLMWLWSRRRLYMLSMRMPGPLSFPFIGSLPQLLKLFSRKDPVNVFCKFIQTYPDPTSCWLGPDFLVIVSAPEDIEVIMKSKSITAKPPRFFEFACDMLGTGILTSVGLDSTWKTHRKIMSPAFSSTIIKSYQPILQRHSEIFLKDLQKFVGKGQEDYNIFVARYISDAVSESMFDYNPNFREGKNDDLIHALDGMSDVTFKKLLNLLYYVDFIYNMSSLKQMQMKATNAMDRYAQMVYDNKMEEYINNNDARPNMLKNLLSANIQGKMDKKEVLDEIKTIWVAGADTINGDTCWLIMMLAMHKDAQDKAFQEIKEYYKDNKDAPVEANDLVHFPYLDMCVKEVLRLYPVAPIHFRYVSEEDVVLKHRNLTIPPGTTIAIGLMASHRNPDIWKNPHEFIPERFTPEETAKRHPYAYYPFSGGNRNCIGQRYGFDVIKTALVYILRKYEIHSDDKMKDLKLFYDVNVRSKTGYKAKFTQRVW